jgi:hypothetical protein
LENKIDEKSDEKNLVFTMKIGLKNMEIWTFAYNTYCVVYELQLTINSAEKPQIWCVQLQFSQKTLLKF